MFIQVALKHPGNVTKKMALRRFYLSREPHTFGVHFNPSPSQQDF